MSESPTIPCRTDDEKLPFYSFTPVPQRRERADGWSPVRQRRFIQALDMMGSVGAAAKAVGMSRKSAYNLRAREGAAEFAEAWDQAIDIGQSRMFDYALDRAMNGVTTVRVLRGGSISVSAGPDLKLVTAALREPPAPRAGSEGHLG